MPLAELSQHPFCNKRVGEVGVSSKVPDAISDAICVRIPFSYYFQAALLKNFTGNRFPPLITDFFATNTYMCFVFERQ